MKLHPQETGIPISSPTFVASHSQCSAYLLHVRIDRAIGLRSMWENRCRESDATERIQRRMSFFASVALQLRIRTADLVRCSDRN